MSDDGKRAYNALLTLLDDDPMPKKKSKLSVNKSREPAPSKESDLDAVEGASSGSEGEEDDQDDNIVVEDDNEGDIKDPFESHFAFPASFQPPNPKGWITEPVSDLPLLGTRSLIQVPNSESKISDNANLRPLTQKQVAAKLKHRLVSPFVRVNGDVTSLQGQFAAPLLEYKDTFLTNRTWENCEEYLNLVALHVSNHIYKTRDRVLKNNAKLKEAQKSKTEDDLDMDRLRDQGFTRPKVLVVLPTRNSAYEFVERLVKISGLNQSENKKRFKDAFYSKSDNVANKPDDFQRLFAGNTNEVFCLGVKFTRQALKLYSSFYACDLIICSPLGLRLIIDKKDFDFLSSIEICVIDQLESIAMQSWTNVKIIFSKLNLIPKDSHDCDFSRVREWYLDDKHKYLRQTVLISEYATPEMLSLYNKYCFNVGGKFRGRSDCDGIIMSSNIHIRQVFTRTGLHSFSHDAEERMKYFSSSLLPSIMRGAQTDGILIVAPTYTDFVVLRNYLEKNDYSYVSVSEYTQPSQLGRGRTFFADGRAKIMLYSARLHHYRRYGIKGAKTVVFYGLPDNPLFYQEFLRSLARTVIEKQIDPDLMKVYALYSKWDALKLERVVGTKKMPALMEGLGDTYEFY